MFQAFYILLLLIPALLIPGEFGYGDDQVRYQIALGVISISLWLSLHIAIRVNIIAALLFLFVASSASIGTFWMVSPMTQISHDLSKSLGTLWLPQFETTLISDMDISAAQSIVFLFAVTIPILFTVKEHLALWLNSFRVLIVISVILCFFNFFRNDKAATGILGNCSADSMFFALSLPLMWFTTEKYLILFPLAGILLCLSVWHSVTGPLMVFAMIWGLFLFQRKYLELIVLSFSSMLATFFYVFHFGVLKITNGRLTIWQMTIQTFADLKNYWFGNGTGSFVPVLVQVQHIHGVNDKFPWAHNEFLQILFEQGVIGLSLAFSLWLLTLWFSRKTEWLFLTNIAFGVGTLSQFPLRMFPTALFMVLICRLSFNKEEGILKCQML